MKLVSSLKIALFVTAVCAKTPKARRDHDDNDCHECVLARTRIDAACGQPPSNTTEVQSFLECVCRMNDDFFDDYSDCIDDCIQWNFFEPTDDDDRLRRYYCDLAANPSPVIDAMNAEATTVPGLIAWSDWDTSTMANMRTNNASPTTSPNANNNASPTTSPTTSPTATTNDNVNTDATTDRTETTRVEETTSATTSGNGSASGSVGALFMIILALI
ncbi:hypothetical protein PVL30_005281 [Lodderomyces elongisporus]|uniref:uncharacterized protein n=1 Tax=Lodderomyces elongisporus TaxID=36914 RepID=UPI00291D76EC|nr:uncharacterized protein PVL30_005281 [Lodderomyces elongisporus]WLF81484.1 hypothetical protein PVL30_005281 [Lodderomyces elongisporus]